VEFILGNIKALSVCGIDDVSEWTSASTSSTFDGPGEAYTMAFTPRQYLSHIDRNLG